MADFSTSIKQLGPVDVVYLNGFLDAHTAPKLEKVLTEQITNSRFKVVVNFTELNYISSAGLGVFMAFIENMRSNNGDIKLTAMKPNVYNIFDQLGFPLLYEIFTSDDEAVQKFDQP